MKAFPLAVVAVLSAVAVAQTPAPQPPTFRTEANYVRVDVFPTKDGAPVPDLTQDDFEVLESGQPQRIEQFERVVIRAAGPQETRIEPNTVAESRAMAQSSRARLFVIFLDTYHVDVAGSHNIRRPLVDALNKMIGPDDLVGFMTPEMSANDITFARKTTTIEGMLARYWPWGERDRLNPVDIEDQRYEVCYPPATGQCADQNGIAAEMIARRHEKRTIDALVDLVEVLRGVREERKAIVAISDGWRLFRPNPSLNRVLACQGVPGKPEVFVDPRNGRLTSRDPQAPGGATQFSCSVDRMNLAQIDNDLTFRELLDLANRANASFYPIDPRGLPVFDSSIDKPLPLAVDAAMLRQRATTLRTIAEATDGLAMVNNNDLAGSFQKIVADLTSYYLLGYYSTGKLDGRFHSIAVRVKRPGVHVRARRGYLAATPAAAARTARAAAADAAPSPETAHALAIESVLTPLTAFARETSLRLRAAAGWTAADRARVWVVGELGLADTWKAGAEADVQLTKEGETLATAHAVVPPGTRTFKVALVPSKAMAAGDYTVSVRTRATSMMATSSDMVPLALPAAPQALGSILVRRGPFTGLKEVPTADLRFRRSEQMRVEIPAAGDVQPSARLLDRTGKPMPVPLTPGVREDADGSRWHTAQVPLVPLAPGDYIVEIAAGDTRTLTAFRVVP